MWNQLISTIKTVLFHPRGEGEESSKSVEARRTAPARQYKLSKCYYCEGSGLVEDALIGHFGPMGRMGMDMDDFEMHLSRCPVCKGSGFIEME